MDLIAFRFDGARGPVSSGLIPLGRVTAVLGANDVGKSRLVRTLLSALSDDPARHHRLYAVLGINEVPRLLEAIEDWAKEVRPSFVFGEPDERATAREDVTASVLNAISRSLAEEPARKLLVQELQRTLTFAFEPSAKPRSTVLWRGLSGLQI